VLLYGLIPSLKPHDITPAFSELHWLAVKYRL